MKISIYSTAFNIVKHNFDYMGAIRNWLFFADEVVIAVNTSTDNTLEVLRNSVPDNVKLVPTEISYDDPLCYGKIENSALQACSGDILIQQNLDERLSADKETLVNLCLILLNHPQYYSYFVPTIDLFGDTNKYINIGRKWYIHKRGLKRGAVNFGLKTNGRPDYNKTSTDELTDFQGNLLPTYPLITDLSLENLKAYQEAGYPLVFHLGYLNLNDRLERAIWWKDFWNKATGGDENTHPTKMEELVNKSVFNHELKLWPAITI
jgi:hypothetical protein